MGQFFQKNVGLKVARPCKTRVSDEMSTHERKTDRIERSLKRLGFQLRKGRGKAFKITAAGGGGVANTTDAMTLDQIERWIGDHIKAKRG
ncbi:MAG: hypothetical protein E6G91_18415 [Alphaproteobacteria bacterium]|nr:MAG: hypothetical protein E6G91_18415 [Alphaproteobacteria bacterium]